jgi:hypothetical protein
VGFYRYFVGWRSSGERYEEKMVALGPAALIGASTFTGSTPDAAQSWGAPVVVGSVVAGGIVGAAIASSANRIKCCNDLICFGEQENLLESDAHCCNKVEVAQLKIMLKRPPSKQQSSAQARQPCADDSIASPAQTTRDGPKVSQAQKLAL